MMITQRLRRHSTFDGQTPSTIAAGKINLLPPTTYLFSSDVFGVEKPPNFLNNVGRRIELDECPVPFESCLVSSFQSARRSIYVSAH